MEAARPEKRESRISVPQKVSERFRPHQRLKKQRDFDRVFAEGQVVSDTTLVVNGCPNGLVWSRLGIVIPRQIRSAVERNRWKRWIREAFRRQQSELPAGLDLVVRPRKGATGNYHAIVFSLRMLTWKLARRLKRSAAAPTTLNDAQRSQIHHSEREKSATEKFNEDTQE